MTDTNVIKLAQPGTFSDSLTETEIEQDGKRFTVRSAPRPGAMGESW